MSKHGFCLLIAVSMLAAGCCDCPKDGTSSAAAPSPTLLNQAQSTDIAMAPEALLQTARKVVESRSLTTEPDKDGSFITSWQTFPGRIHVARRWIERTRFRVTVTPAWQNRAGQSHLQVTEESEERAPTSKDWDPTPSSRTERSAELLEQIRAAAAK